MYWYKSKALFIVAVSCCALIIAALQGCSKPAIKETGARLTYFDIKGYFERDSARLTKLNKPVYKTVMHNGVIESKTVHITNWGTEFAFFEASDINRPAWKNSYTVVADSDITIYLAKDSDLFTREVMIKQLNGKLKWIRILNHSSKKNRFYSNGETLSYFPDSLYLIQKRQSIRLLGTNRYVIKGLF